MVDANMMASLENILRAVQGSHAFATLEQLRAAEEQGRADFTRGIVPPFHPQECGDEMYEAWFDGWDRAQTEANDPNYIAPTPEELKEIEEYRALLKAGLID